MTTKSINQSIDHKIMYVGPPPKPDYFCMDQIRKFHYSKLQNLILCLFQNIFKTEELWKLPARKKDDSQILLEMGLWGDLKNSKDER